MYKQKRRSSSWKSFREVSDSVLGLFERYYVREDNKREMN